MGDLVYRRDRRPRFARGRVSVVLALPVLVLLAAAIWRVGDPPEIQLQTDLPGIGKSTRVVVEVAEPRRGVGRVTLELVQGVRTPLAELDHQPRAFWALWGPKTERARLEAVVGSDSHADLVEGTAILRVTATRAGTWLRRPPTVMEEREVPVLLTPPAVSVLSDQTYVRQGGCEAVVYRVGGTADRHGVRAGEAWFPGYPLPGGGERDRFVIFGVPYDLEDSAQIRLEVADVVGNAASVSFLDRFTRRALRTSRINLSDSFIAKVVPEIVARSPEIQEGETPLETYLEVNGRLREINAIQLRELAGESRPAFVWTRAFRQQPNTQVMDAFAARRTYYYQGEVVDRQDHLGFDLASVRKAEVLAANRGRVVIARYFGIYGNTVVLDHGYGLMTLYAHLSSIEVEPGQAVELGDVLGRSGETGLAGGDHLHFTVLVGGEPVDPLEWFDAKWIRDRLVRKLGSALPFEDGS